MIIGLLLTSIPLSYADNLFFIREKVYQKDVDVEMSVLFIKDTQTQKIYKGPRFFYGNIEKIGDFDKDGNKDAFLKTECGGTGCPNQSYVVTLKNSQVIAIDIGSGYSNIYLKEERNDIYIVDQEVDIAHYYKLNGKKLVLAKKINGLKAIKQVRGPGIYTESDVPKVLVYDVDQDKKSDKIVCKIWQIYGSLLCKLPLPNGKYQESSMGCDRFGVLTSKNNGYHEFVCNFNTVITFDGIHWIEKDSPEKHLF
jgi:hypothetical protein